MTRYLALCCVVPAVISGCMNTSGNTNVECRRLEAGSAPPPPGWGGTVFTIVMENKSRDEIVGNRDAPYINQLVREHALAAGYRDPEIHPSEPNYLWMVAGQNFGMLDNDDPESNHIASRSHLADQLELAGLSWKTYQDSMGAPCGLKSHGRYAAKHNPFVFFDDINGWDGKAFQPSQRCNDHVVDYSELEVDLARGTVPRYVFITPNLDHDMHDGSIADGDRWLQREVPKILESAAYKQGGVLFLLWDEGGGSLSPGDDPPFVAISPNAKHGYVSSAHYDTSSYLLTVQKLLGLAPLPCAAEPASVSSMDELFTVPL